MADSFLKRAGQAVGQAVGIYSSTQVHRTWNLLSGTQPGGLGSPPARYTRDFLRSYSQLPWLRAVANKIAMSVAMTEWKLYVKSSGGIPVRDKKIQRCGEVQRKQYIKSLTSTEDLKEITEHPLLELIHNANSFHTGQQARKVTMLHIDLVGEAFWLKERDALGVIIAVWPIPPDWILNTPTPVHPYFRVGFRSWRGEIPDTEFVWFQDTDPANPYARGAGTAQSLSDELETDEYAAKHTKAFFYNRAKPDLLIFPKTGTIRGDDIKRLETDWMQANQGFWRAFKPYFMTREVGVHEMDQNFRAMQLVQLREFERDVIIHTFGMPPELLGILGHSNRATIDAADYLMSRYVLRPRLEFLREVLQERLVPEFDDRLIIDYESPVSEDKQQQIDAGKSFPWAANVDEQREWQGLEPLDNDKGKVHVIPTADKVTTMEDAAKFGQEKDKMDLTPPPAPVIAPGGGFGGPKPKPGAPKPGAPKPGAPKPKPAAPKPPKKGFDREPESEEDRLARPPRWKRV